MKKLKTLLAVAFMLICVMGISTKAYALDKPGTVTNVKQVGAGETSVSIQWDAQIYQYCYYNVELSVDGVNFIEQTTYNVSSANFYINNLSPGKTYYVRVRAYTYNYSEGKLPADAYSTVLKVVTSPSSSISGVKQTNATTNSITLSWNPVSGATKYHIYAVRSGVRAKVATTTTNSAVVKNLNNTLSYNIEVYPVRSEGTFEAMPSYVGNMLYSSQVRLLPSKVQGVYISVYYSGSKQVCLEWIAPYYKDGYQVELYTYNGKKPVATYTTSSTYEFIKNIKTTTFYKIRVRAYVVVNGSKKYGEYSNYVNFSNNPSLKLKKVSNKTQMKVSWAKSKGATNYTVYMSTKSNGGYKKVLTTKKTSLTISKYKGKALKKHQYYYVYVVANRKVGKTTYKSKASNSYYFYFY